VIVDFVVKKGEFFKELQYVQGVVERKTTVPILSNLLLETTGNLLAVTATDLDVTVQCICPANIKVSGALTLSARKLFDMVRLLPESDIHFKGESQNWMHVHCERSKFKVASLPKENFPDVPEVEGETVTLPAKPLRHMINSCIFAITQEESRYTLNGALMIINPGSITCVTTDGHRLVFISRNVEITGVEGETRVLVPRKTLVELSKLAGEDLLSIEFGSTENHLFFKVGERLLISRVLTGQFPNYEMVIPKDNDRRVVLDSLEFSDALKRVAVMADEQSHAVRLSIKKDQLDIFSNTSEVGEAKESLPASYQGEPLEIGFNAQYLLDFLGGLGSDTVELVLRDEETQGLLKPSPDGDYVHQYVVMPMRL
jgi:DNA polymerase III subunit beta